MSYLDAICVGILLVSLWVGYKKGLINRAFSFVSTLLGIFLAYTFYPTVSALLIKQTGLYVFIMNKSIKVLNLDKLASNAVSSQDQMQLINKLKIPGFIKKILIDDNNPVVYDLLKATGLEEYIGGTIATIAINALAFLIVLGIVILLLGVISYGLNIVSKLPVIHQLNAVGGIAVGIAQGVIMIWILCILLSFAISVQGNEKLLLLVEQSPVLKIFYEHNFIMKFLSNLPKTLIK